MDVAIRELITVTDRGRPVAVIGPPVGRVDLALAAEAGWLTPASSKGLKPLGRHAADRSVLEVLDEDRFE